MKTTLPKLLVICLLALIALAAPPASDGALAADQCWAVSEAGPIVKKEVLIPASDLHAQAQGRIKGKILSMQLCQERGRWIYKLVVLGASGRVENVTLDAKRPF
jgi:uncharacterized membrane protein YkoI